MLLIEAVREMSDIERSHLATLMITPADGGYLMRASIDLYLPDGATHDNLPPGVTVRGIERYPDVTRLLDWRVPIWDQVLELLSDAELSQPHELGNLGAVECSRMVGDEPATTEALKHWCVMTHGAPRSQERREWLGRMVRSPYSATL